MVLHINQQNPLAQAIGSHYAKGGKGINLGGFGKFDITEFFVTPKKVVVYFKKVI